MRNRDEIESTYKNLIIPEGRDDIKLTIELLLDIRDLLMVKNYRSNPNTRKIPQHKRAKKRNLKQFVTELASEMNIR